MSKLHASRMDLTINQRIKLRVSTQITVAGLLLGLIYVSFSNGFSDIYPFINGAIIGLILGFMISFLELWIFTGGSRKMRFIVLLILRTIVYITLITAVIFIISSISRMSRFNLTFLEVVESREYQDYLIYGNFGIAVFYALMFAFSINFTRMISRKMGQGVLVSFITGTFYQPVVQDRIIMFLGIKNIDDFSTRLDEYELFKFLNDYFYDITSPIVQHQGIIYEYVEDEIVITWRPEKGIDKANCLHALFSILDKLDSRNAYYSETYGLFPYIIGSLHFGSLIRAEIGKIKTQIVFQGDAMNTTSRLFQKCKELNEQILISETLMQKLDLPVQYRTIDLGTIKLKGRAKKTSLFTIKKPSEPK